MKKIFSLLLAAAVCSVAMSQTSPVKLAKKANIFRYATVGYAETADTQFTTICLNSLGNLYQVSGESRQQGPFIPGYSEETTFVDLVSDSVYYITTIIDGSSRDHYKTVAPFSRSDIKYDTARIGGLTRYTCSINSNKIELYFQDYPVDISPVTYYGHFKGILVSFWRNGQCLMQLSGSQYKKEKNSMQIFDGQRITSRQLNNIKQQRMVVANRIFDNVQLSWGKTNAHIEGNAIENTPFDSVLHFAGGTLALKRVKLPKLPAHYQTFVEIHQRSNGDAYDRTGSLFVVPMDKARTFFDGMNFHPDSLPQILDAEGHHYQGICATPDYRPAIELVRFFTSFGVNHFNGRVQLDGLEWEDENYYKQEVTEVSDWLQGEVWIGIWIGNYDGGGHLVTVDIKSYPNDYSWQLDDQPSTLSVPIFNTCNVLEMAGQNYGRLFRTDSLTVSFEIPEGAENVRLRYLATGHGGWGGGDEFNPKANTVIVDGSASYVYTPWRCDCGRYREFNPVSGNFWNGISSSDLSRSGWCPGTATQPTYFDLGKLTPGPHTMTIAIPQGQDEGGSFSHWCVSGALLIEK